jgi:hypothetical protein
MFKSFVYIIRAECCFVNREQGLLPAGQYNRYWRREGKTVSGEKHKDKQGKEMCT